MGHRLIATVVLAVGFGWFAGSSAQGQDYYYSRAFVDRPSTSGPSSQISRLGGLYTRQGAVASLGGGLTPGVGGRGLPPPSFFGAAGGLGRLPPAPMPQALTFSSVGYAPGQAPPMLGLMEGASSAQLARISRLWASQSLTVPLGGLGPYELRFPDRPYYAPAPQGGAVHEFFGLRPAQAEDVSQIPIPGDGLVGLLERQNEQRLQDLRVRALQTFKRAMTEDVEDRGELLSAAQRQLNTLHDLESHASVPCLLLVHTALEKGQIVQAMRYLAEAVRWYPALFVDRPDIASYYGDAVWLEDRQQWRSELLERQMRRYLRVGEEAPGASSAYALQAYCAWVLNDRTRVGHALDQMMAAERGTAVSAEIVAVRHALAAAMKSSRTPGRSP